jgi:hypothetical protein
MNEKRMDGCQKIMEDISVIKKHPVAGCFFAWKGKDAEEKKCSAGSDTCRRLRKTSGTIYGT